MPRIKKKGAQLHGTTKDGLCMPMRRCMEDELQRAVNHRRGASRICEGRSQQGSVFVARPSVLIARRRPGSSPGASPSESARALLLQPLPVAEAIYGRRHRKISQDFIIIYTQPEGGAEGKGRARLRTRTDTQADRHCAISRLSQCARSRRQKNSPLCEIITR